MTISSNYRTKDFTEIIFLLVNEAQLIGAERLGSTTVEFIFSNRGQCDGLIAQMSFNDSASVSSTLGAIKKARRVIHQTP